MQQQQQQQPPPPHRYLSGTIGPQGDPAVSGRGQAGRPA